MNDSQCVGALEPLPEVPAEASEAWKQVEASGLQPRMKRALARVASGTPVREAAGYSSHADLCRYARRFELVEPKTGQLIQRQRRVAGLAEADQKHQGPTQAHGAALGRDARAARSSTPAGAAVGLGLRVPGRWALGREQLREALGEAAGEGQGSWGSAVQGSSGEAAVRADHRQRRAIQIAPFLGRERIVKYSDLKILRRLVLAGLLDSQKGQGRGFTLARPAEAIRFEDILLAVDAYPDQGQCAFGWGACSEVVPCPLHASWSYLNDTLHDWASNTTLGSIKRRSSAEPVPSSD